MRRRGDGGCSGTEGGGFRNGGFRFVLATGVADARRSRSMRGLLRPPAFCGDQLRGGTGMHRGSRRSVAHVDEICEDPIAMRLRKRGSEVNDRRDREGMSRDRDSKRCGV
jgi:hypothetical protein